MEPFRLQYGLTRRQRATDLFPWIPALAGSFGFCAGTVFLAVAFSPWFVLFLLLPVAFYRGLFVCLFQFAVRARVPVELSVDGTEIGLLIDNQRRSLSLEGVIQVYRSGDEWNVLHRDGTTLVIPAEAIAADQIDYLKSFARRAAEERRTAS